MSGSFYRGTTTDQDGRFANKEKKFIRSQQWPEEFNTRVDIKQVCSFSTSDFSRLQRQTVGELADTAKVDRAQALGTQGRGRRGRRQLRHQRDGNLGRERTRPQATADQPRRYASITRLPRKPGSIVRRRALESAHRSTGQSRRHRTLHSRSLSSWSTSAPPKQTKKRASSKKK